MTDVFVQIVPVGRVVYFHVTQRVVAELTGDDHVLGRAVLSAAGLVSSMIRSRVRVAAKKRKNDKTIKNDGKTTSRRSATDDYRNV